MSEITILKFFGTFCSPCRALAPVLKQVKEETGVEIKECDVDVNEEIFTQYSVRAVPTLVFLKNGLEIGRKTGLVSKDELVRLIEEYRRD